MSDPAHHIKNHRQVSHKEMLDSHHLFVLAPIDTRNVNARHRMRSPRDGDDILPPHTNTSLWYSRVRGTAIGRLHTIPSLCLQENASHQANSLALTSRNHHSNSLIAIAWRNDTYWADILAPGAHNSSLVKPVISKQADFNHLPWMKARKGMILHLKWESFMCRLIAG